MSVAAGRIVVITRKGTDGASFSFTDKQCIFGRNPDCDIRIVKPNVSLQHAKIRVDENNKVWLQNLSETNVTLLNSGMFDGEVPIKNGDVFTICDRSFRYESPEGCKTTEADVPTKTTEPAAAEEAPAPLAPQNTTKASPRIRRSILQTVASPSRRKSVAIGPALSPEIFDKNLPPATPLKRGATPTRPSTLARFQSPAAIPEVPAVPPTPADLISFDEPAVSLADELAQSQTAPAGTPKPAKAASAPASTVKATTPAVTPKATTPAATPQTVTSKGPTTPAAAVPAANADATPVANADATPIAAPAATAVSTGKKRRSSIKSGVPTPVAAEATTPAQGTPAADQSIALIELSPFVPAPVAVTPVKAASPASPAHTATSTAPTPMSVKSTAPSTMKRRLQTPVSIKLAAATARTPRSAAVTPSRFEQAKTAAKKALATPIREAIKSGVALRAKPKLPEAVAEAIQARPALNAVLKKALSTPVRAEIAAGAKLRATMRKMATPVRAAIATGKQALKPLMKKMATPVRKQIVDGVALRETKPKMTAPLQDEIKAGVALKAKPAPPTIPAALAEEIVVGKKLRSTKAKMATPLKKAIQSGATLRATKKTLPASLQEEIKQGVALRSRPKIRKSLGEAISKGVSLKSKLPATTLATPVKKQIKTGIALRKTLPAAPTPLRAEIQQGKALRKTLKAIAPELKSEIEHAVPLKAVATTTRGTSLKNKLMSERIQAKAAFTATYQADFAKAVGRKAAKLAPASAELKKSVRAATRTKAIERPSKRPAETDEMVAKRAKRACVRADVPAAVDKALYAIHHLVQSGPSKAAQEADYDGIAELLVVGEQLLPAPEAIVAAAPAVEETLEVLEVEAPKPRASRRRSLGASSAVSTAPSVEPVAPSSDAKKTLAPRLPEPQRMDVTALTVAELKAELAARGLTVSGLKADLQRRLSSALEPSPPANDEVPRVVIAKRKLSMIAEKPDEESDGVPKSRRTTMTSAEIGELGVAKLRDELSRLGLPTHGLKLELRERLMEARMAKTPEGAEDVEEQVEDASVVETEVVIKPVERVQIKARRGRHARTASTAASVSETELTETAIETKAESKPAPASKAVEESKPAAAAKPARRGRRAASDAESCATSVRDDESVAESDVSRARSTRGRKAAPADAAKEVPAAEAAPVPSPARKRGKAAAIEIPAAAELIAALDTTIAAAAEPQAKRARKAAKEDAEAASPAARTTRARRH
eukprot:m.152389 g.152389  ORF g.152389 m.152389 type:complete len:1236 (+) comp9776_c0_seq1:106-3813(+)